MTCAHPEGCDEPIKARGLCAKHYMREHLAGRLTNFATLSGSTRLRPPDSPLPNPWINEAPGCPNGHGPEHVFLWHNDRPLRWFCQPCRLRFDR